MAFDISTAKPVKQGGFDISTAKPVEKFQAPTFEALPPEMFGYPSEQEAQQLKSLRDEQLFAGLPGETQQMIRSRTETPQNTAFGGGPKLDVSEAGKMADLERLRIENPYLAEVVESATPAEALAIGYQTGLRTVARGAGKAIGMDAFPDVNQRGIRELGTQQPVAFGVGEIAGSAAPFIAAGPVTGTVGRGLTVSRGGAQLVPQVTSRVGQAAAQGALGAAEGASIAAGQDREASEVAAAAGLGGIAGLVAGGLSAPGRAADREAVINQGRRLLKEPSKKEIAQGVAEATPTAEQLRSAAGDIYQSVSDLNIQIDQEAYESLFRQTLGDVKKLAHLPKAGKSLTPETKSVLESMNGMLGDAVSIDDLEKLRRLSKDAASAAARAGRSQDAAASNEIADRIDSFFYKINPSDLSGNVTNIGQELKVARDLWGRAKRSELLDEAIKSAENQATGFENGIRIKLRQIVGSKKLRPFFKDEEIKAMEDVIQGSAGANFFKKLGKLGFGRGQQTNMMSGTLTIGVASDLFGGIAATVLSGAGQVSKGLAERLTKNNAAMATQLIRAGTSAEDIARIYLKFTPKAQQSAEELSALLMRPSIELNKKFENELLQEAAEISRKRISTQPIAAGLVSSQATAQEEAQQ